MIKIKVKSDGVQIAMATKDIDIKSIREIVATAMTMVSDKQDVFDNIFNNTNSFLFDRCYEVCFMPSRDSEKTEYSINIINTTKKNKFSINIEWRDVECKIRTKGKFIGINIEINDVGTHKSILNRDHK